MNVVDRQMVIYGNLLIIAGLRPMVIGMSIVSIISKVEKIDIKTIEP